MASSNALSTLSWSVGLRRLNPLTTSSLSFIQSPASVLDHFASVARNRLSNDIFQRPTRCSSSFPSFMNFSNSNTPAFFSADAKAPSLGAVSSQQRRTTSQSSQCPSFFPSFFRVKMRGVGLMSFSNALTSRRKRMCGCFVIRKVTSTCRGFASRPSRKTASAVARRTSIRSVESEHSARKTSMPWTAVGPVSSPPPRVLECTAFAAGSALRTETTSAVTTEAGVEGAAFS
ncbi:hypothetical protein M885DRAFT_516576 [Pelagophyceae sp. CCMP2097]|nr:hypothetical protein M885DRAFT_516576 [Pelagophyceae sp. CCMP2097]|mmetsp:Transcript_18218/g.61432  ORF Transcript_18218/g.61432 Transcript_18218/m.61432 type:complete len:231 (-) Transcript_18218:299-991(-)